MPTTEAGKRPHQHWCSALVNGCDCGLHVAIEAEAREDEFDKGWAKGKAWGEKQERARIRAAVEGLPVKPNGYWVEQMTETISRAAVLRIIDGEDTDAPTS